MILGYDYDLWDGKKVIGTMHSFFALKGGSISMPEVSALKQSYYAEPKTISCPIFIRTVSDDGVTITAKRTIDVRKKSKRQIKILMSKVYGF